jgi:SAM-dependent methyltransferase
MSCWETETFKYDRLHVRLQKCLALAAGENPRTLLELGCGVGLFRAEIKRRLPELDYYGCDISASAVERIGDPHVVQADLAKDPLPFEPVSFDVIAGSGILEYIPDIPSFLGDVHRRLNPQGVLAVSYYNMGHLYRRLVKAVGLKPHRHPDWRNDLSSRDFERLLEDAGLLVEKVIPVNVCLTRLRGAKYDQHPLIQKIQAGMPAKRLFGHQLTYVARKKAGGNVILNESEGSQPAVNPTKR